MSRGRLEMTLTAAEATSRLSEIEDAYLTHTTPV
jgi:hypothetical protein